MLEHHFNGPPFTIGIEEELMLLDADSLDLANEIEAVLAAVPAELEGQVKPELLQSVLEVATTPCEDVRSAGEQLRVLRRSVAEIAERRGPPGGGVRDPPLCALGGPADRRSAPLPGAGRRARLHRPPGADLRHPRPRRNRGPRQGDLRRGRDPALPAAAARPVVELALLARRADRVDVLADAGLPGLSQGRNPAPLRHLGDLLPPGRADDARRRDRGLHLPVVGRATASRGSAPSRRASSTSRRASTTPWAWPP